jgi:hypothetical protein
VGVRAAGAVLCLVVAASGCEGGIGLPRQQPGETYSGERREVTGTIEVDDYGCVRVRLDDGTSYAAIWPLSANQGDEDYVNLGWFQEDLGDGDRVRGTAALTPLGQLRDWGSTSYWWYALGACVEDGETEAIVFDSAAALDR